MLAARVSSRSSLRNWYLTGLASKVEQAVLEGRADAAQATELHRLMNELLDSRPAAGKANNLRMEGRAVR